MDKRLLILGVALVIASVIIGSTQLPKPPSVITESPPTVLVAPNSFAYGTLYLSSNDLLELFYTAGKPIDFYLLNSTGFDYFRLANSTSIFTENAARLGVLYETLNSTLGAIPYSSNYSANVSRPVIESSSLGVYAAGNYFVLFSNKGPTMANVTYNYINVPLSELINASSPYGGASEAGSIFSSVIFIVGVIIAFFALFRGRDKKVQKLVDIEANRLYESIANKDGANTAKTKKRGGSRHGRARRKRVKR